MTFIPLQTLSQAFSDLYFRMEADGTIVDYACARPDDLYVPPAEFLGRKMQDVLPPEAAQQFALSLEKLQQDKSEIVALRYNLLVLGGSRVFEARLLQSNGGQVLAVVRDVTQETGAQDARDRLAQVLESTSDFVATVNGGLENADFTDGSTLYINCAGREMLGINSSDDVNDLRLSDLFPAAVCKYLQEVAWPHAMQNGVWSGDGELCHRNGYCIPVSQVIIAHRGASGEVEWLSMVMRDITPLKESQDALRKAEARYRGLFENAVEGIFQSTLDGRYTDVNPQLARIYGDASPQELIQRLTDISGQLYVEAGRREEFVRIMNTVGRMENFESAVRRRDGEIIWISENARAVYAENPESDVQVLAGYEGTVVDITDRVRGEAARRKSEAQLRASEERLRDIVEHSSNLFYSHTPEHVFTYLSPQVETFLDCTPEEGKVRWTDFATDNPINADGLAMCQRAIDTGQAQPIYQLELRGKKGRVIWVEVNEAPVVRDGKTVAIVGALVDITQRKNVERQLKHQAFHDALTGLPNRALFMDRLSHALESLARGPRSIAVLFLDLDRFKIVNDSLGHETGDQLLQAVSRRLRACLRPGDTVARLGGDEFTVLMPDIRDVDDAIHIAQRIAEELSRPFKLGSDNGRDRGFETGHEAFVTTSIGIALSHSPLDSPDDLLRDADVAMYRAKSNGRAGYEVFDPEMNARALERLTLETDLWQAIGRGELRVYYQPKVHLETQQICGFEALVRWEHPTHGLIPPNDFIPLAEETGIIFNIGQWVLREACAQGKKWCDKHNRRFEMSVNLSARQLAQPSLAQEVAQVLAETGLEPALLKLEITESVVMGDAETSILMLRELKNLGLQLAIDDFGTGYSSLSYLRRFPVNNLKIDRTFIKNLGVDNEDTEIVRAIIKLAQTLGLSVTAEGVENAAQWEQLRALDCDLGQGYFFARPLPRDGVEALLETPPKSLL